MPTPTVSFQEQNRSKFVADILISINSITRKYIKDFSLPHNSPEKKARLTEMCKEIYAILPAMERAYPPQDLYKLHTTDIAARASQFAVELADVRYPHIENTENSVVNDIIQEINVPYIDEEEPYIRLGIEREANGELDENGKPADYVTDEEGKTVIVPNIKYRKQFMVTAESKDALISTLLSLQNSQSQENKVQLNSEEIQKAVQWETAKQIRDILDKQSLTIESPNGDEYIAIDFGKAIDDVNVLNHYKRIGGTLFNEFEKAQGITTSQTESVVSKILSNGEMQDQTVYSVEYKLAGNPSNLARTLLQKNIRDSSNAPIDLYKRWKDTFNDNFSNSLRNWINNTQSKNMTQEDNAKFFQHFLSLVGQTNSKLASIYSSPLADGWTANGIANIFIEKPGEKNGFFTALDTIANNNKPQSPITIGGNNSQPTPNSNPIPINSYGNQNALPTDQPTLSAEEARAFEMKHGIG